MKGNMNIKWLIENGVPFWGSEKGTGQVGPCPWNGEGQMPLGFVVRGVAFPYRTQRTIAGDIDPAFEVCAPEAVRRSGTSLCPVLCISTNASGSHLTLWPVGTSASQLRHDDTCDRVYVEMVTVEQAALVKERGHISFSSTEEFYAWLTGILINTTRDTV
jgi:hypothetical protein